MGSSALGRHFAGGVGGRRIWLSFVTIVAYVPLTLAQDQFQQFFPAWDSLILEYLGGNCSQKMEAYKRKPLGEERWLLVDCVLDQFSESRKAEAAAAALTFGLAPMLLQSIGPNTSQTSFLFMRRPVLASLLAICSPWPSNPDSTIHPATRTSIEEVVVSSIRDGRQNFPRRIMASVVSLVEYAVALGAAANVASLTYQLGHWAFFSSANNIYDPILWTYNALIIHLLGVFGMFLQYDWAGSDGKGDNEGKTEGPNWFQRWLYHELTPNIYNRSNPLEPKTRELKKRPWLLALSVLVTWVLYIAPTLQVVLGTIMLSGSLLTGQGDARDCLFRYFGSAVVARALLTFETACMKMPESPAAAGSGSNGVVESDKMLGGGQVSSKK